MSTHISSPWDYVRFSVVCKNWYTVAKYNQSKSYRLRGVPLLLIHQSGKSNDPWHLYNVLEEKLLSLKCYIPDYRYCSSCHGWVITVKGKDLSIILVNPFCRFEKNLAKENSKIHLPKLKLSLMFNPRASQGDYFVSRAIITVDLLLYPTKCTVVVVHEFGVAFMSLQGKEWTYFYKREDAFIHEIVPVENDLLVVLDDALLSLDLSSKSFTPTSTRMRIRYILWS